MRALTVDLDIREYVISALMFLFRGTLILLKLIWMITGLLYEIHGLFNDRLSGFRRYKLLVRSKTLEVSFFCFLMSDKLGFLGLHFQVPSSIEHRVFKVIVIVNHMRGYIRLVPIHITCKIKICRVFFLTDL